MAMRYFSAPGRVELIENAFNEATNSEKKRINGQLTIESVKQETQSAALEEKKRSNRDKYLQFTLFIYIKKTAFGI